jgi:hypothetical protein
MNRSRQVVLVAVVAALAIVALGWFLLISPKRADISSTREETTTQLGANSRLQQEIKRLNEQAKDLPNVQARVAAIDQRIPATPALPVLIRSLTEAATASQVRLVSLTPSVPKAAVSTGTAAPPARAGAATAATGLQAIDLAIIVDGTFPNIELFFRNIERMQRSLLVTGFSLLRVDTDDPATHPALTGTIAARVFFSPVQVAAAAPTRAATPSPSEG